MKNSYVCESCGNNMMSLTALDLQDQIKKQAVLIESLAAALELIRTENTRYAETALMDWDEVQRLAYEALNKYNEYRKFE